MHNDLSAISDVGMEGQLLSGGSIRELTGIGSRSLLQLGAQSTVRVLHIDGLDLVASRADSLVIGSGLVAVNGPVISPHDLSGLVLELAAGLQLEQAAGHHAVGTADGDGLVPLQGVQLPTLLTGDIHGLLILGDGGVLQLVQGEQVVTGGDVEAGDHFKAGNGDVINIHEQSSSLLFMSKPVQLVLA